MADGAVTATAARPLPRTRSLTPQCVTLPLSEIAAGDRRLDAEVYLSDGFTVRRAIRDSLLAVSPLGQLARIWQPSRLKGIRVDREHGAPFLAATQAFDIWPTPSPHFSHPGAEDAGKGRKAGLTPSWGGQRR